MAEALGVSITYTSAVSSSNEIGGRRSRAASAKGAQLVADRNDNILRKEGEHV